MNARLPLLILTITVLLSLIQLWTSSHALPPLVASHFDASGAANGFMPRNTYLLLISLLLVGVPAFLVLIPSYAIRNAGNQLSLPYKEYWLRPENRDRAIAHLLVQGIWLAELVVLFLWYMNWLVLKANALQPAQLSLVATYVGLIVFLISVVVLLARNYAYFRQRA